MKDSFLEWKKEQKLLAIEEEEKRKEYLKSEAEKTIQREVSLRRDYSSIEKGRSGVARQVEGERLSRSNTPTADDLFGDGPRPIDITKKEWERLKGIGVNPVTRQSIKSMVEFVSTDQYNKFKEKMVSVIINGEYYINGPAIEWKRALINWLNPQFKVIEWHVSITETIEMLKESGITFNQNKSLILPLISKWLEMFREEVKNSLRLKLNMIIME